MPGVKNVEAKLGQDDRSQWEKRVIEDVLTSVWCLFGSFAELRRGLCRCHGGGIRVAAGAEAGGKGWVGFEIQHTLELHREENEAQGF